MQLNQKQTNNVSLFVLDYLFSTTQKALTFVSAFCVRVGRGVFQEPTGRALARSDKPCGGLPLAGNRSKHPLPCSLPYYFKCIRVSLLRWRSGVVAQSTTINRWFVRNLRRAKPAALVKDKLTPNCHLVIYPCF